LPDFPPTRLKGYPLLQILQFRAEGYRIMDAGTPVSNNKRERVPFLPESFPNGRQGFRRSRGSASFRHLLESSPQYSVPFGSRKSFNTSITNKALRVMIQHLLLSSAKASWLESEFW